MEQESIVVQYHPYDHQANEQFFISAINQTKRDRQTDKEKHIETGR